LVLPRIVGERARGCLNNRATLALFLITAPVHAQAISFHGRVDVELTTRRLWHGLTRVSGIAVETQPQLGLQRGTFSASAGALATWDMCDCGLGNVRLRGEGRHGLGEIDLWGEGRLGLGGVSLAGGATRYTFHGDAVRGGIDQSRNTTELYAIAELRRTYLSPRVETWVDVGPVGGTYFELGGALPLLGWPFPPFWTAYLDGELGYNLSQGPNPDDLTQFTNYAERGFTHARLSLAGDFHTDRAVRVSTGMQFQLNFDDAVRSARGRGSSAFDFGFWIGASWSPVPGSAR
jgi:hypothetical protein